MGLFSSNTGRETRHLFLPLTVGIFGAAALLVFYLGILTLLQSAEHALGQFAQDWLWVALVASGFGAQLGLYVYLRQLIQSMNLTGATVLTGAGTGTSTLGMIACCAHHIADIAPLVGLAGASGLSGVVAFLADYKMPFILFGLLVNLFGIAHSLRTIQKQHAHLLQMRLSVAEKESLVAPACHQA